MFIFILSGKAHCLVFMSNCLFFQTLVREMCYNYLHTACCRSMDRMQQISTDPCGPKMQPGHCALIRVDPALPPQLAIKEPPLVSPSEVLMKQSGLSLMQAAEQMQSGQPESGSTQATLVSICRPRPSALGTKPAPKLTRISVDPSKEIDLIPVCIPGPQSANVLSHSQTESSFCRHSPQSPRSLQSYTSQPHLNPNPSLSSSLSPKPSLSPQPQRTLSPGSSTQSQVQSEKPAEENNDFR